jgi:hypothetical protein
MSSGRFSQRLPQPHVHRAKRQDQHNMQDYEDLVCNMETDVNDAYIYYRPFVMKRKLKNYTKTEELHQDADVLHSHKP